MTELYLYIEEMKEKATDPNQYAQILRMEQEFIEMSIMNELNETES